MITALSRHPPARNAALAVAVCAAIGWVDGPRLSAGNPLAGMQPWQIVYWLLATVVAPAAITLRGVWPVPMLAACALATAVRADEATPVMVINLVNAGLLLTLYTVAERYGWAVPSFAALAGALALCAGWSAYAAATGRPGGPHLVVDGPTVVSGAAPAGDTVLLGLSLIAACAIGATLHSRRAYHAQLRARARDLATAEERDRLTRELHDVVAHGLALIVIQAQGGQAALENRPADTRTALETIVRTGRDSLADLRRTLGTPNDVGDAWHPQPGIARLPDLLDRVREAGTPVRLDVEGTSRDLPPATDLSLYRIAQEALTNTMKHAGPGANAQVVVRYADREVALEVRDDGPGDGVRGSGNGLRGMRERTALLGGRFTAGADPRGGFRVRAVIPLTGSGA